MKKEIFTTLNIDMYDTEIIVAFLDDPKDISKHLMLPKNKHLKKFYEESSGEKVEDADFEFVGSNGYVEFNIKTEVPYLLFIKRMEKSLKLYEIIVHETNHIVYQIAICCGFTKEREHNAYLQQTLFRKLLELIN